MRLEKARSSFAVVAIFVAIACCGLCGSGGKSEPKQFLFAGSHELSGIRGLLARQDIEGVQIVYDWKALETAKDVYDFSQIEKDLQLLDAGHKKLFIQVQDRFFRPQDKNVPFYLMRDVIYDGGIVSQVDNPGQGKAQEYGWVAQQWNPNVRERYQRLLQTLAHKFDGRIYGVNLPESAIDMTHDHTGFTCDKYFNAEIETMKFARRAFTKSYVVQYVNFWPCEWENDHKYMSRTFEIALQNNIGLGGPDVIPHKAGQMKNSYRFFNAYKDRLTLVAMAVQEPTLTYTNPKTGKRFTKEEFERFARDYLGAKIIFWTTASPWLQLKRSSAAANTPSATN